MADLNCGDLSDEKAAGVSTIEKIKEEVMPHQCSPVQPENKILASEDSLADRMQDLQPGMCFTQDPQPETSNVQDPGPVPSKPQDSELEPRNPQDPEIGPSNPQNSEAEPINPQDSQPGPSCPQNPEMELNNPQEYQLGPSNLLDPEPGSINPEDPQPGPSNPFLVNTSIIAAIPTAEQASELQQLGLTVFDQDELEQGIMAQVDHAIAAEEQLRLKKLLEKDMKSVMDDISSTKEELSHIEKVLSMLKPHTSSREAQRKLESVKRQKENKVNQMKKLKAKQKSLKLKIDGNMEGLDDDAEPAEGTVALEAALGLAKKTTETDIERMIRLGEMTPFGTVMDFKGKPSAPPKPKPKIVTDKMSDFEMFLMGQDAKNANRKSVTKKTLAKATKTAEISNSNSEVITSLKRKHKIHKAKSESDLKRVKSDSGSDRSESPQFDAEGGHMYNKRSDKNMFDIKDKRNYRPSEIDFSHSRFQRKKKSRFPKLQHEFSGDADLDYGDEQLWDPDAEDDYVPDEEEMRESWIEEQESNRVINKKSRLKRSKTAGDFSESTLESSPLDDKGGVSLDALKSMHGVKKRKTRDLGVHRSKDDGNDAYYMKRLREHKTERLKRKQQAIANGTSDSEETDSDNDMEFEGGFKVPFRIWNKLYRYQKTGVKWLWELHAQKAGGIVGDEMGLGKTIQIIAFLTGLKYSQLRDKASKFRGLGPTIIVCPTTVMHQWVREFHKWSPLFRVVILHGSGSFVTSEESLVNSIVKSHSILITSYSSLVLRQEILLQYDWHYIILDEGHKIRNPDAQVTLACKQFRTCHRLILSGSPVQNNLKELWSLIDFVFPGKLGTLPDFMAHFSVPIVQGGYANATQIQVQTAYKCACILRDTINPYLLRRMKSDVKTALDLPQKNEQVLFCRLTEEQKDVYKEYLASKECNQILSGNFMVFPGLITLRKVCNHPDISTGGPSNYLREDEYDANDESTRYGFWKRSGKLIVIEALLKLWKQQGHRVLLFTQSRQMLDILEKFVDSQDYSYLRMDGSTSISARQPLINKFNMDISYFVFLLTTRVGGLGVNLTGANRVVIYDPDWNPSTDTQARERAWRIGQTRQVTVYRLLTSGTIEEKIYHRQIFKQFLSNRVLKDPKQRRFFKSNDLYELFQFNDDDPKQNTETSAIFAGTGSDVKIPKKMSDVPKWNPVDDAIPVKKNRFDEMKEKKIQAEKDSDEEELEQLETSDEKRKRMMELARKLSQQVVQESSSERINKDLDNVSDKHTVNGHTDKATTSGTNNSICDSKNSESSQKIKHKQKSKKKKKKKRKDAKFEGERIAYLAKHGDYKPGGQTVDEVDQNQAAALDDYVLHNLFKKSGVHSALQHDKIMMSSDPDYLLVEAEAERVAKDAAAALKQSRANCYKAASGVPSWTGQNGQPSKPRFGQKKNTKMLDPELAASAPKPKPKSTMVPTPERKHFDGSEAGSKVNISRSKPTSEVLNSSDLISRMKARNNITTEEGSSASMGVSMEMDELITDIRNYIAFQARVDGQATTQELLDAFSSKIPPHFSAKFKSMLKQLCTFDRKDGIGTWWLRPEFR